MEGEEPGQSWRLDPNAANPTLIGQSDACDIRLTDPLVSRRHASLELDGHRLRLRDLDSTNGTLLDGVPIVEAFVESGHRMQDLLVEIVASPAFRVVAEPQ